MSSEPEKLVFLTTAQKGEVTKIREEYSQKFKSLNAACHENPTPEMSNIKDQARVHLNKADDGYYKDTTIELESLYRAKNYTDQVLTRCQKNADTVRGGGSKKTKKPKKKVAKKPAKKVTKKAKKKPAKKNVK